VRVWPGGQGRSRKRPRSGCGVATAIPGTTKNSVLKSPGVSLVEHPCPKRSPGNYGQKRVLGVMPAAGWGARFMIHNSDSLWLSISIVWAALLLAALLLGSLFFVISN
jgi:hypothetical protein